MTLPPVVVDLQGAQSVDHRDRGVARYVLEHARAIERVAPGLVTSYTLNPRLPPPGGIEDLIATGRVSSAPPPPPAGALVHLMSPIELSIPLDELLPGPRRRRPLVVTLYDLVPDVLAERYLADPGLRRRWRTRVELVRRADAVLVISANTGKDAIDRLHLDRSRVTVIGTGTGDQFRPPADRDAVRDRVRRRLPGLGSRWVVFTGGTDDRKNVERLLEAWALLSPDVRREWQLVVACSVNDLQRNHLLVRADQLGFAGGLLVPGFVPDELLVMLNQGADLAVYPSLYEGYGLPVAEALACGTPAVASNTSSLPELLPPEGLFDPLDPGAIAASIDAALRDPARRRVLQAATGRADTWDAVARRTVEAYRAAGRRAPSPPPSRRRPPRVAFVTPLPPQVTGVAAYSHRLLAELVARAPALAVDAYVDAPPHARAELRAGAGPAGVRTRPLASLARVEALEGPYDHTVISLGNSEYHTGGLALLQRRRATVIAHDVVLLNLFHFAHWQHPDAAPGGFRATLHRMYPGMLPDDVGEADRLDPEVAARWGIAMARGPVAASRRYLVTSEFAASWARLDAGPDHAGRIATLPFPMGLIPLGEAPVPAADRGPLIVSFGLVDATKAPVVLVRALSLVADRRARLAFVGPVAAEQSGAITGLASELGVAGRVEMTGPVEADQYRAWLQRAGVAVQLRTRSNGESSGAVGDCLAAGVPTVVSPVGSNRDLPGHAAVVLRANDAAELASALDALLGDPGRRTELQTGALAHAAEHTFARTAEALLAELGLAGPAVGAA